MTMDEPKLRKIKIAMVAGVLLLVGVAYQTGLLRQLADPAQLAQRLRDMGALGFLAYVLAYAIFQPFGVPGTAFVIAAPLIWPWPIAFALAMTGTMAASVVGFSFARFIARDWISSKVPARFKKYERVLEERGFATVAFLRLVFWMPQLLHVSLGVSKVSFWKHFWGSLVGYTVPILLVCYFGQSIFVAIKSAPYWVWGIAAIVVALVLWMALKTSNRDKHAEEQTPAKPSLEPIDRT
jgi:uncharacterized membrane protein YdjX (TVP38/TMEM64 family)